MAQQNRLSVKAKPMGLDLQKLTKSLHGLTELKKTLQSVTLFQKCNKVQIFNLELRVHNRVLRSRLLAHFSLLIPPSRPSLHRTARSRRRKFPFRKRSLPFETVDAISQNGRCH